MLPASIMFLSLLAFVGGVIVGSAPVIVGGLGGLVVTGVVAELLDV